MKGELINMTRAWDKEKCEFPTGDMNTWTLIKMTLHPPGVREVMGSIPVGDSDFSLSHARAM